MKRAASFPPVIQNPEQKSPSFPPKRQTNKRGAIVRFLVVFGLGTYVGVLISDVCFTLVEIQEENEAMVRLAASSFRSTKQRPKARQNWEILEIIEDMYDDDDKITPEIVEYEHEKENEQVSDNQYSATPLSQNYGQHYQPQQEQQNEITDTGGAAMQHYNDKEEESLEMPLKDERLATLDESELALITTPRWYPREDIMYPNKYKKTNKTMAACLFLMDDSIRLMEWLAYHYTVLPLGYVMIAIDPKSRNKRSILNVLKLWKNRLKFQVYTNDTYWLNLNWDEGYSRLVKGGKGKLMKWYRNKDSDIYIQQSHKRRQNYFAFHCMRFMRNRRMEWTILTDSDEFLLYNYMHPSEENETLYDAVKRGTGPLDIDRERSEVRPVRQRLPTLDKRVTIADFLNNEYLPFRCIKFPGLQFSSQEDESRMTAIAKKYPSLHQPQNLMTLLQDGAGPREGKFSKTMIDVSFGTWDQYVLENVVNIHNPQKIACGFNGNSGSRADYIGSVFRINHYRSGTLEAYLERSGDRRGAATLERFRQRGIDPVLYDEDIAPWVPWFVDKMGGPEVANKFLFEPLAKAYEKFSNHTLVDRRRRR